MATAVQSGCSSSPTEFSQSKSPTWEMSAPRLRGTLWKELHDYKRFPDGQILQTIELAERATKWAGSNQRKIHLGP